ncbi:MAG: translation initiation factor IF-2 subunit beta [Candidatus Peribacteraceae bacterium]|nr:translation initiation factor IF-2 subunit beta [Candidatus Peribacteraceae bacterium]
MQDYEKLLDVAIEKLPKDSDSGERFQMPKASIMPAGARTVITNFTEIASTLRRESDHLQKFLLKELATSGEMQGNRLVVQGRFRSEIVDKKIDLYAKEYVICPDCGKPDTKIAKEDRHLFLKCEACGSKHVVKKV